MNVSEFLSLKAEKHTPFGGNQFMSLEWSHPRGRGKPLAQTLAQTGFFSPWHCPASVAPGRAGFLYGTDYYSGVAPLAQTGMLKDCGPSFPVAPGQAGRAAPTPARLA